MLVLIATDPSHHATPSDHHAAVDGELVAPVVLECPDEYCDVCRRAWFGLVSHAATTTAMVVDRPGVSEAVLRERIHGWLDCNGTIDMLAQGVDDPVDDPVDAVAELVDEHVREIREICATFPVGTVLSRMGQLVAPRAWEQAA